MKVFAVSNEFGNIIGVYESVEEAEKEHGTDINLDALSHPTMTMEDFRSLIFHGIQ